MRSPWLAVSLLSAAALAYEVLLTRLFAIAFWHHFAHLIISLALLGYGMSGSFLALSGNLLSRRFATAFNLNVAVFVVSAPLCIGLSQRLSFNPLALGWEPGQWLRFAAIYLVLSLPFFAAANAIALALWRAGQKLNRIYAADLIGAGIGSLGIVVLLFQLDLTQSVRTVTTIGCLALAAGMAGQGGPRLGLWLSALALAAFAWMIPGQWVSPVPSAFKDLSQTRDTLGAEILATASSPLAELTLVANEQVPFRIAPGLSLSKGVRPPEQLALFADGNLVGPVSRWQVDDSANAYLDALPSALAFHLLRTHNAGAAPEVLVLDGGTGEGVRQALFFGAGRIDMADRNPQIVQLLAESAPGFVGPLLEDRRVSIHPQAARDFIAATEEAYDLIMIDASGMAIAGLGSASETPELTQEAVERYYDRLEPGGFLAISFPLSSPPRLVLKLALTLMTALEQEGADVAASLAALRSWRHGVLVLKRGTLTGPELTAARTFAAERSFDLDYLPGLTAEQTNRFNRLEAPLIHDAIHALLGSAREDFVERYKFDLRPATDDRPFAYDFFRWRTFDELRRQLSTGALAQVEWGYVVLLATLVQSLLLSVLLILVPVLARRGAAAEDAPPQRRYTWAIVGYFGAVGIAFLCVEIAFVQTLQRLLHHPVFAVSAALAAFLVFAGIGSALAPLSRPVIARLGLLPLVLGMIIAAVLPFIAVPAIADLAAGWPLAVRIAVAVALLAPLATLMGMPFPLGLALVSATRPGRLPLAWAVNGCASVVAAVAAQITALTWGFAATLGLGLAMYLAAVAGFRALYRARSPQF